MFLATTSAPIGAAPFVIETVDASANDVGQFTSLALDALGNPHVSYQDVTTADLKYAWKAGGVWIRETADGSPSTQAGFTSLALDASGNAHISYLDATTWDLKYARRSSGVWTRETADGSPNTVGQYTSLALGAQGNPHVVHYDMTTSDLKYARKSGGVWIRETADGSTDNVGLFTSIALDTSGNPHVSYFDYTTFDLKYAWKSGGVWTVETADESVTDLGQFTSIALDTSGNPHVSYLDNTTYDLKYAWKSGGSWTRETVDGSPNGTGYYTSLALDTSGNPHVSYWDATTLDLMYARKSANVWTIETADGSENSVGHYTSLALDAASNPHITYYDATTGNLKYAHVPMPPNVLLGPVVNPANAHSYYLLNESNWPAARMWAAGLGGVLVTINDAAEQAWVFSTFGAYGGQERSLWLGLTDAFSEGDFEWLSGESVDFNNWLAGEPNDSGGNEDFGHIIRSGIGVPGGLWNDLAGVGSPFRQFDPIHGVVEVNSGPDVLVGPVENPANRHNYFLLTASSWQAAQAKAQSLGGNLVTINDEAEQAWVFSTFGAYGGQNRSLWLGLTDEASEGDFVWVSGEPVGYTAWLPGEPGNAYGDENYAHMMRIGNGFGHPPGLWNDIASPVTPFWQFDPFHGVVECVTPRSWSVPTDAATIQAAVNLAASGDTVLVAPGTYTGPGNKDIDFGGKSVLVRSDAGAAATIIDVQASSEDRARAFDFDNGEPATAIVDGFTIINGWEGQGGAIRIVNGARPTIRNCSFLYNTADASDNGGGAIFCELTAPLIQDCVFESNSAVSPALYGGAILSYLGGDIVVDGCTFTGNSAIRGPAINMGAGIVRGSTFINNGPGNEAGALRIWGGCVVEDCVFENNSAELGDGDGGAVWLHPTSNTSFTRCVFLSNSSNRRGGAMNVFGRENGASVQITSCTFHENSTGGLGSALWLEPYFSTPAVVGIDRTIISSGGPRSAIGCGGASSATLTCCDVTGHGNGDWVGCIAGQDGSNGNFSANPQFCAPGEDLTLTSSSPCLPGNHPYGADCGLIGALDEACVAPVTDVPHQESSALVLRVFPTVSGSAMTVRYSLPLGDDGSVEIFDVSGRKVWARAVTGASAFDWDQRDVSGARVASGQYFLRLTSSHGDQVTERLTVIR